MGQAEDEGYSTAEDEGYSTTVTGHSANVLSKVHSLENICIL